MASEELTQQVLYSEFYGATPMKEIFDDTEPQYVLVKRLASDTHNHPAFPSVPPLELLPKILQSIRVKTEKGDLEMNTWKNTVGTLVSRNIHLTHQYDIPSQPKTHDVKKRLLNYLEYYGDTKFTYTVCSSVPTKTKSKRSLLYIRIDTMDEYYYNEEAKCWLIKPTHSYEITDKDGYYMTNYRGLYIASTSLKNLRKIVLEKIRKIESH